MARYKVTLYGRRVVRAEVIVEGTDEDDAAKNAERLACADERGQDVAWEDYDGYEGVNGIHSDEVDEVDPATRLTGGRTGDPLSLYWHQRLSPASTILVAFHR